MLDLDSFKGFNDTLRPSGGRRAARRPSARRCGAATRAGDAPIATAATSSRSSCRAPRRIEAFEVVERIRRGVAAIPAADRATRVTISAGVACHPDDGQTKDELVEAADQSLYLAKPSSRDRDESEPRAAIRTCPPSTRRRSR